MTFYKWMLIFTYVLWVFVTVMALYIQTASSVIVLIQASTGLIICAIAVFTDAN